MIIAEIDNYNDCSFAIKFTDESAKEKVEKYMQEGLKAWYCAAHVPVDYDGEYWTNEEVENFYWDGYAEPTMELLQREGIEAECVDIEYDDDENVINADLVVEY